MIPSFSYNRIDYLNTDCFEWLQRRKTHSVHGVVTDPPFGLEYTDRELDMKRNGNRGGVWRLPPAFDGYMRTPLPRFTVLSPKEIEQVQEFYLDWAALLLRPLVPGAHAFVATTPFLSHVVSVAIEAAGFERRGEVIRLVRTMRGGDRPKDAHDEFSEVSVIPKAMHEPWLLFRKPLESRVRDNLRRWWTGGLRRPETDRPFGDVIVSGRAMGAEKAIAPHPSLKPQEFLRQIVRAVLPLGKGVVLDPFAGSGSTLAAAWHVGYRSIGIDRDPWSFEMAQAAIPALRALVPPDRNGNGLIVQTNGHAGTPNGRTKKANGREISPARS